MQGCVGKSYVQRRGFDQMVTEALNALVSPAVHNEVYNSNHYEEERKYKYTYGVQGREEGGGVEKRELDERDEK